MASTIFLLCNCQRPEKIIERAESILENKIRIYIEHNKLIEQYVDKVILLKN